MRIYTVYKTQTYVLSFDAGTCRSLQFLENKIKTKHTWKLGRTTPHCQSVITD